MHLDDVLPHFHLGDDKIIEDMTKVADDIRDSLDSYGLVWIPMDFYGLLISD